jgi:hypothetical protein
MKAGVNDRQLNEEESTRLSVLLRGCTEIPADFAGWTEDEAVEILQLLNNISAMKARQRVRMARGQYHGDEKRIEQ